MYIIYSPQALIIWICSTLNIIIQDVSHMAHFKQYWSANKKKKWNWKFAYIKISMRKVISILIESEDVKWNKK